MRLLLAMKSKKKIGNRVHEKKNGIKFSEKFFLKVAKSWNLAAPLLTPALNHSQIYVKTRKKCISARLIAKKSPQMMIIWQYLPYNGLSK